MESNSTFLSSDGAGYDAQMGRWSRRLAALLVDFCGTGAGERVLDVGCGTGSLAFELARRRCFDEVHGIDLSAAYVRHAVERPSDAGVNFTVGDACDLPYADGHFDRTLSCLVLQFIPEPSRAVREMARVTREGGTVTAATWDTIGGHAVYRMFFDTAAVLDERASELRAKACGAPMASADGLLDAWRRAGLADIVLTPLFMRMDYEDFSDYWTSIDGRDGPYADYLQTLDRASKSSLQGFVKAAFLAGKPDGPRSFAATAWAIKGRVPTRLD